MCSKCGNSRTNHGWLFSTPPEIQRPFNFESSRKFSGNDHFSNDLNCISSFNLTLYPYTWNSFRVLAHNCIINWTAFSSWSRYPHGCHLIDRIKWPKIRKNECRRSYVKLFATSSYPPTPIHLNVFASITGKHFWAHCLHFWQTLAALWKAFMLGIRINISWMQSSLRASKI